MRQRGDRPAPRARIAASASGSADDGGGQDLDGDRAVQTRIARAVDLAHPPGTERPEDLVRPDARARGQRHSVGPAILAVTVKPAK